MDHNLMWQCQHFAQLNTQDLYRLLQLREQVFTLEQQCFYGDIDDVDLDCLHILGQDAAGHLLAYARLIPPGQQLSDTAVIGRVVVAPSHRGQGLGKHVVAQALAASQQYFPEQDIQLSAQLHVTKLYQDFGFVIISEPYDDEGITHIDMRLFQANA